MKRPGWLGGQGGPEAGDEPEDEERTRAERARRERLRAQRRLAAKAAGEDEGKESPEKPQAKRKPKADVKPKADAKATTGSKPKDRKEPKPKTGAKPETGAKPKAESGGKDSGRAKAGTGKARTRKRGAHAGGGAGTALKRGVQATRSRTKGVPARIAQTVLKTLGAIFAIFFDVVGFVLNVLIWIVGTLAGPTRAVAGAVARFLHAASRQVTPARALAVVVAGAAILLALSQFADYRSISVGTDAYAEVETVAPAPETERDETGSAHSYLMVPLAIAALGLLGVAVARRRWRLCRAIAAIGAVAVLVSLLIDRPAGLDLGDLEQAFDGVRATLLGGFYAQLFAGALLVASSLLLGRELRPAAVAAEAPARPRRRPLRRPPKTEGARA